MQQGRAVQDARPLNSQVTPLLAGACGYWSTAGGACGSTESVRAYIVGPRCCRHSPSALAGRPHPDDLLRQVQAARAERAGTSLSTQ
ncbi:hypothetical protein ACQP1W_52505 (plasmid) [Spirillospora sp. CA-255316]